MVKRFFKDSAIYGFGKFLAYGIGFFLIPVYTHVFAPTEFGIVDLLNTFARLALLTVALEVAQAVIRFLPDATDQEERVAYSSTALWFSVAAYGVFTVIGWLGAETFSAWLIGLEGEAHAFRVALLMIWAAGIFNLMQNQLRWQAKSVKYTIASIVDTVISLGLTIVLIVWMGVGIEGVFWGQLIGLLAGIAVAYVFSRGEFRFMFRWSKLREMLRFSLPLVPSGIAVFVYLYIDRLTINALLTTADVGIFGVGYRIASIVSLLMFGFQISMMPLVYQHYRDPQTPRNLANIFRYFVAGALLMVVGLSLFSREIISILTTPEYLSAWVVVPFLVPATLLSNMYIFAPGLGIAKRTGAIAMINVGGAVLNTILNLLLIPSLGILGAALATLISMACVFATFMSFSQRIYPVPHAWGRLGVGVAVTIVIVVLGLQVTPPPVVDIVLKLALCVFAAAVYMLIGLVDINELRGLARQLRLRAVPASAE